MSLLAILGFVSLFHVKTMKPIHLLKYYPYLI